MIAFLFSGNKCNTLTKAEVSQGLKDDGDHQTKKTNRSGLACTYKEEPSVNIKPNNNNNKNANPQTNKQKKLKKF